MLQPIVAMRNQLAQQGQRVDPAQLVDTATQMASSYKGGWNDLAREMYINQHYSEAGGAGGLLGAAINRMGGPIGISPERLADIQRGTSQAATQSPAANMLGALRRAQPKAGPAYQATQEIARGAYGPVSQKLLKDPRRLLRALRVSNPGVATSDILGQYAENAAALTPADMQVLRAGQAEQYQKGYDKYIGKTNLAKPYNRLRRESRENEYANRFGIGSGGALNAKGQPASAGQIAKTVFDPKLNETQVALRAEAEQAARHKMNAPLNRVPGGLMETLFGSVSKATPETTGKDVLRDVLGSVKLNPGSAAYLNKTYPSVPPIPGLAAVPAGTPAAGTPRPSVPRLPGPPTAPGRPAVPTTPYPRLGVV
jgi:hypothetical protein